MLTGLVTVAALAGGATLHAEEGPAQVRVGDVAPGFRLQDLEGKFVDLEDFRGRYLVLHFGTSW